MACFDGKDNSRLIDTVEDRLAIEVIRQELGREEGSKL